MTNPHPDPTSFITQVPDHSAALAIRTSADISSLRKDDDDVYCIYNMRGVRRDLKRREAKLIPEPFALHFKNGYMHISWDQMTNWPWIPASEVVGDDWEYRAILVPDLDAETLDWILDKVRQLLNDPVHLRPTSSGSSRFFSGSYMSFVREDLTYFVMPRRKFSPRELYALKRRVGEWLLKRTDIFAGLQLTGQWSHTTHFLLLAGFHRNSQWERRIHNPNQAVLISASCVPLRPDEAPDDEIAKILVFDQKSMRRTAWNHIWIPHSQVGLAEPDAEEPVYPQNEQQDHSHDKEMDDSENEGHGSSSSAAKGKQPERNGVDENMAGVNMNNEIVMTSGNVAEDADWGLQGRGLKVWLRRTFIFQLMSMVDR